MSHPLLKNRGFTAPPAPLLGVVKLCVCVAVCGTVTVAFRDETFAQLENCTVIEGHLELSLISPIDSTLDLDRLSFPKLRAITHYLLVFRMDTLRQGS